VSATDARTGLADRGDQPSASTQADLDCRMGRLPEGHPSSPRYRADATRAADGRVRDTDEARPLTDAEHVEHVADVKARLADAKAAGLATDVQYTLDGREVWSYDRRLIHDGLIDDLYAQAATVPCEGRAIIAGGLAGAGKTTVLTEHAGIDLSCYLVINPDLIKEEMARRGLVPEVDGLAPMEASELVHEECSHVAKRLAHRAQFDGRNLIWDVTMSRPESAIDRIRDLRAAGYARVDGIFVDVSIEASLRRADARHRAGHDDYRKGVGLGGRYAPPELTLAQEDPDCGSKNRHNFERAKSRFDSWLLYDNSVDGEQPVLVDSHSDRGAMEAAE
jgi:predicted ABC-type ATPase